MKKTVAKLLIAILLLTAATGIFAACDFGVKYTICYIVNGSVYSEQTVLGGDKITFPDNPVVVGFTFGGWYLDQDYTEVFKSNHVQNEPAKTHIVVYAKLTETGAGEYSADNYVVAVPSDSVDITAAESEVALRALVATLTSTSYMETSYFKFTSKYLETNADVDTGIVTNTLGSEVSEYYVPSAQIGGYEIASGAVANVLINGVFKTVRAVNAEQLGTSIASENTVLWRGLADVGGEDFCYQLNEYDRFSADGKSFSGKYKQLSLTQSLYAYSYEMFGDIVSITSATLEGGGTTGEKFLDSENLSYGLFSSESITLTCKKKDGDFYIVVNHETNGNGSWTEVLHFTASALVEYSNYEYVSPTQFSVTNRIYEAGSETLTLPSIADYPDGNG